MRHATILCLVLFVTIPGFAQEQQAPPPEAVLHDILGLTDAQMSALHDLEQTRVQTVQPILPQIAHAQQALASILNAVSPDPTAVGNALLAVRGLQAQVEQAQQAFSDGFNGLLTDAQRTQVQHIHAVEAAVRAAQALHAIGL